MTKRIFIAGHQGMVGRAIHRQLVQDEQIEIITRTHNELDLIDQSAVNQFFADERIDEVYLAAARVGGIYANNTFPAEFIYQNLMIQSNVIHAAHVNDVQKLLFLGSSCIYPKLAKQPIKEEYLLDGPLEPTNEPYAIAKIAGIKMCESYNRQYGRDYRCVMPTNLYGPYDNFDDKNSHVVPALIRRFHEAKVNSLESVEIWGAGNVFREFLYVDDLAKAVIHVMSCSMDSYSKVLLKTTSHVNIGSGEEITIKELALLISKVVGYEGALTFDENMPAGTPRKLLDTTGLEMLNWRSEVKLITGIEQVYSWYINCFYKGL